MALSIPEGPLVSFTVPGFTAFNFVSGKSKPVPGGHIGESQPSVGKVPGQATAFDRWGRTRMPLTFDMTWEYMINNPLGSSDLTYLQTQQDALVNLCGTTGTLVALKFGSIVTVSGQARFLDMTNVGQAPTWKQWQLHFFISGGFS